VRTFTFVVLSAVTWGAVFLSVYSTIRGNSGRGVVIGVLAVALTYWKYYRWDQTHDDPGNE
jgi:hypothetical protein